jgi:hypothetical protein
MRPAPCNGPWMHLGFKITSKLTKTTTKTNKTSNYKIKITLTATKGQGGRCVGEGAPPAGLGTNTAFKKETTIKPWLKTLKTTLTVLLDSLSMKHSILKTTQHKHSIQEGNNNKTMVENNTTVLLLKNCRLKLCHNNNSKQQ